MTISTTLPIFNDPAHVALLRKLYAYDPHEGTITYIGPEPIKGQILKTPVFRDDKQVMALLPTSAHRYADDDTPVALSLPDDFYATTSRGEFIFRGVQVATRHLAWRLAHLEGPMPTKIYRRKGPSSQARDLKLASFTTDPKQSLVGRRYSAVKNPNGLPARYINVAIHDERVRAAIVRDDSLRSESLFRNRVTDMFRDRVADDIMVYAAARNPDVIASVRALIAPELEDQMKATITRLMTLHPPLVEAWRAARAAEQDLNLKTTQPKDDHHES
jgi:hypothetical protein